MQNKRGRNLNRKHGAVLVFSLFLTGAAAFGTFYTINRSESQKEDQERLTELEEELRIQEANAAKNVTPTDTEDETEDLRVDSPNAKAKLEEDPEKLLTDYPETNDAKEAAAPGVTASLGHILEQEPVVISPTHSFTENSVLDWPVAGNVIIDYSMNGTVYFPTLNVYKYNPALVIGAKAGSQVVASAAGVVESITQDAETGTTVTVNLGNDYKLVYGQLQELAVAVGDTLETGALLGQIAEPTKYYCEEGSNLYFKMTRNGEPVDPFLYLGE